MAGVVVVFDFDKTILNCDSDDWVVDELGATNLFDELLCAMPYNSLMDRMMMELHTQGNTIQDIAECLKRAPIHPKATSAIKSAYALGCDLRILSDANTFFIETILKHHDLYGYFSEINTNPSHVDSEGRLRILPYHDFTSSPPHGCRCDGLCPQNMCKGLVIERMKAEATGDGDKRLIYLGDGKGDFCPSTRLRERDYVMPRKNYPVWELICNDPWRVKAEVHEWSNWDEQEEILLALINNIIFGDGVSSSLISECRFRTTTPSATQKPLQPAV